jgi:hypothetical protein
MRAAVFFGPNRIEVAERPDPGDHGTNRRGAARRPGLHVRLRPLVIPPRVTERYRFDRP